MTIDQTRELDSDSLIKLVETYNLKHKPYLDSLLPSEVPTLAPITALLPKGWPFGIEQCNGWRFHVQDENQFSKIGYLHCSKRYPRSACSVKDRLLVSPSEMLIFTEYGYGYLDIEIQLSASPVTVGWFMEAKPEIKSDRFIDKNGFVYKPRFSVEQTAKLKRLP